MIGKSTFDKYRYACGKASDILQTPTDDGRLLMLCNGFSRIDVTTTDHKTIIIDEQHLSYQYRNILCRKPYKLHNCMYSITWYFTRATYNEHRKSKLEIKRRTMNNKYNEWQRTRALEWSAMSGKTMHLNVVLRHVCSTTTRCFVAGQLMNELFYLLAPSTVSLASIALDSIARNALRPKEKGFHVFIFWSTHISWDNGCHCRRLRLIKFINLTILILS